MQVSCTGCSKASLQLNAEVFFCLPQKSIICSSPSHAVLRSPSHQLSLSPFPFFALSPSHALYSLHFFRYLPPPFFCLPKDINYCSSFFIIIFLLFFFLLFHFMLCTLHYSIFFGWVLPSAPFQVQPTFVFVVLPKMHSDTKTHTQTYTQ